MGAAVHWAGSGVAVDELAVELAERRRADGARPYVVPFGGSAPVGARGYLNCARELDRQAPDVRHVVVAVGSGGTMAGLAAGPGADRVLGGPTGAVDHHRNGWPTW
jgi:D-cysteine desulfhydrase